ncbi:porin [Geitlerinema splendidum]|nr:porin [Geitlerinema splendidum]
MHLTRRAMASGGVDASQMHAEMKQIASDLVAGVLNGEIKADDPRLAEILTRLDRLEMRMDNLELMLGAKKEESAPTREAKPTTTASEEFKPTFKPSFYAQLEYKDSDQVDSAGNFIGQHALNFRRLRFGGTYQVDPQTGFKLVVDTASGNDRTEASLKDASVSWKSPDENMPLTITAGQFALPLGMDLRRSSSVRLMPEYSGYNRSQFSGEFVRGITATYALADGLSLDIYGGSSMTISDREQSGKGNMPFGRGAGMVALRFAQSGLEAGVSNFQGARPSLTGNEATNPEVWRNLWYFDASYKNLLVTGLDASVEFMVGNDRRPLRSPSPTAFGVSMSGWMAELAYHLPSGSIFGRAGLFDPNRDIDGNAIREYGLGYRYDISKATSLTFAYEWIDDPSGLEPRYKVATLRYQFKF